MTLEELTFTLSPTLQGVTLEEFETYFASRGFGLKPGTKPRRALQLRKPSKTRGGQTRRSGALHLPKRPHLADGAAAAAAGGGSSDSGQAVPGGATLPAIKGAFPDPSPTRRSVPAPGLKLMLQRKQLNLSPSVTSPIAVLSPRSMGALSPAAIARASARAEVATHAPSPRLASHTPPPPPPPPPPPLLPPGAPSGGVGPTSAAGRAHGGGGGRMVLHPIGPSTAVSPPLAVEDGSASTELWAPSVQALELMSEAEQVRDSAECARDAPSPASEPSLGTSRSDLCPLRVLCPLSQSVFSPLRVSVLCVLRT